MQEESADRVLPAITVTQLALLPEMAYRTVIRLARSSWPDLIRSPNKDPRNSEHAMELADDRYRFVLERPIMTAPGGQWVYNGGTTAVLGRLIEKGSGLTLRDYAEAKLFAPLGITAFEWVRGYDGADIAASGLRLRPRDLARIGQMVLNGGRWEGRQIVSEDWLAQSFETRVNVDVGIDYGYQWWLSPEHAEGPPMIAGMGNGGQRLFIVPEHSTTSSRISIPKIRRKAMYPPPRGISTLPNAWSRRRVRQRGNASPGRGSRRRRSGTWCRG